MKKLEEIEKKPIFNVPEGYFEHLPMRIQSRVLSKKTSEKYIFRYFWPLAATSLILLITIFGYWYFQKNPNRSETIASIHTEELIAYLQESDITTEELIEQLDLSPEEITQIENEVYNISFDEADIEELLIEEYYNDLYQDF